jgi:hypothetical protein
MKEDTMTIDPTWMARTGGYARDMTLHDHFAGLAMQALFMDADFCAQFGSSQALRIAIANGAYLVADAMLDEREKK